MKQPMPICVVCRHFFHRDAACAVFPDGIPHAIWSHIIDHRKPFEGDGGVQFEPDPDLPPEEVQARLDFEDNLRAKFILDRWAEGGSPGKDSA